MRNRLKIVKQFDSSDCGLACLAMIYKYYGLHTTLFDLKIKNPVGSKGLSFKELLNIARKDSFKINAYKMSLSCIDDLQIVHRPIILHLVKDHFVVLSSVRRGKFVIFDPESGKQGLTRKELMAVWSGKFIDIQPDSNFKPDPDIESFKDAFAIVGKFRWLWLLGVIISAFIVAVNLTVPYALSHLITAFTDPVSPSYSANSAIAICSFLILLFLGGQWCKDKVTLKLKISMDDLLTKQFVQKLLYLPPQFYMSLPTGDLLSRINSTSILRDFYSATISSMLIEVIVAVSLFFVLFVESVLIATIALLAVCFLAGHLFYVKNLYKEYVRDEVHSNASAFEVLTDSITGINSIKSQLKENIFFSRWSGHYDDFLLTNKRSSDCGINIQIVQQVLDKGMPILLLVVGFIEYSQGRMSQQKVFFCYFILLYLLPSVKGIFGMLLSLANISTHSERLSEINRYIKKSDTIKQRRGHFPELIRVEDLTYRYNNRERIVIDDLSYSIRPGKFYVLTGISGSGKSTLMNLIGGNLNPHSGNICYRNNIKVIYLNQDPYVFRGSILDNIIMFDANSYNEKKLLEASRMAGIHDEIMQMENGYSTLLKANGSNISGGQKQRIVLARAIYSEPDVLLLDEATSQLNAELEARIIENIRQIYGTKIVASHRTEWMTEEDIHLTIDAGVVCQADHVKSSYGEGALNV